VLIFVRLSRIFYPPMVILGTRFWLLSTATFEVAIAVAAPELFHFGIEPTLYRGEDYFTDETSEPLLWTEINNLIAAITP
jgi:hypothetical protein